MSECYKKVTIEISNICNAKCKWCTTGSQNRMNRCEKANFMTAEMFKKGIEYMLLNSIIDSQAEIELYNWGEPLLNPEIQKILSVIKSYDLPFHLSTNASFIDYFTGEDIDRMSMLMVSISGFSQTTYGKIHGFELSDILQNIDKLAEIMSQHNLLNRMQVNMHMYKFNLNEYENARIYFKERNIKFYPHLAYFNDYKQFQDYLLKKATKQMQKDTERHIITTLIDEVASRSPKDYVCPQTYRLVTDEQFNIVPCCRLTKNENLGNLFEMSIQDIRQKKQECIYCQPCLDSGQSYTVHQPLLFHLGI